MSESEEYNIDEVVKLAYEGNLIVVDSASKPGKLGRLISLMKETMRDVYQDTIFEISGDIEIDLGDDTIEFYQEPVSAAYEKAGGIILLNKKNIIVAVGENFALLGCY